MNLQTEDEVNRGHLEDIDQDHQGDEKDLETGEEIVRKRRKEGKKGLINQFYCNFMGMTKL